MLNKTGTEYLFQSSARSSPLQPHDMFSKLRSAHKTLTGALFQQASCLIVYHLFFCSQHKHIHSAQCALVNFRAVSAAASVLPDLEHAPTAE